MSAIGDTPAVLAFSLARSRWRMYSGARPRKSKANTRTAQAMTALSMPTLGPGGDFNGTGRGWIQPTRPLVARAYTGPAPRNYTKYYRTQLIRPASTSMASGYSRYGR